MSRHWVEVASKHYCAVGLESGVDWRSSFKLYKACQRSGQSREVAALEIALQGAVWPSQRRIEVGYAFFGQLSALPCRCLRNE